MEKEYKSHFEIKLTIGGKQQEKIVDYPTFAYLKRFFGIIPCKEVKLQKETAVYTINEFFKDYPSALYDKDQPEKHLYFNELRTNILNFLADKQRNDATEALAHEFLQQYHVYTIRHDEKPECWIYAEGIYVPHAKTYLKQFCERILLKAYTTSLLNAVYAKVEVRTFINQEDFFKIQPPELLPVKNGILNLNTLELKEFNPKYFFFNKLPIEYDVDKECPNIIAFFYDIVKSESDIEVLQELFGFLLYKDYKYEKAFMFTGNGRNGKGKTIELIKRFLGVENCSNISLQALEKDQYAMGELFNKMANLSADISSTALRYTGAFKSLTGHDLVSAPRKFLPMVNFVNYAKMIFCANELPETKDLTEAFFDRWIILDFPFKFLPEKEYNELGDSRPMHIKKQDPNKIEKLCTDEELSGLLNWALIGWARLSQNKGFSYSFSTEETKKLWIRRSSSAIAFINEYLDESWGSCVLKRDFRKLYRMYCRENKLKAVSDKQIKATIEQHLGGTDAQKNLFSDSNVGKSREYVWLDIAWKPEVTKAHNVYNHLETEEND